MEATYTKLRSGEWGLRIKGEAKTGLKVKVTKRSGEVKTETVDRVIWSGNGITLAAIFDGGRPYGGSRSRSSRRSRGTWTGCSCGSVEEYGRDSDCATCAYDHH